VHNTSSGDIKYIGVKNVQGTGSLASDVYCVREQNVCISPGIVYNIETKVGDCGFPVIMSCANASKTVILGIHVAGIREKLSGLGYFLSKELWDAVEIAFNDTLVSEPLEITEPKPSLEGTTYLKDAPVTGTSCVTKMRRSKCYGAWGPAITEPAKLGTYLVGDKYVDPLVESLNGYGGPQVLISTEALAFIGQARFSQILRACMLEAPWNPRTFTYDEAWKGVPGVKYCEAMARNTSAGYPLCNIYKKKGKMDAVGDGDDYDVDTEECRRLEVIVYKVLDDAAQGIRNEHIFKDTLKDECRKPGKAARMISCAPLVYMLSCRMMFCDYARWYMCMQIENSSAIGLNPYGNQWKQLFLHLSAFGGMFCLDADFTQLDKHQPVAITKQCVENALKFYNDPENEVCRRTLVEEIYNSVHIQKGMLVQLNGGITSGSFFTALFNTDSVIMAVHYCILGHMMSLDGLDILKCGPGDFVKYLPWLYEHMRMICLGDDHVISVSAELAAKMLPKDFEFWMRKLGYKYTGADKMPLGSEYKKLTDCTFLKRSFHVVFNKGKNTGQVLAPLDIRTIMEMPYWCHDGNTTEDEIATIRQAFYELSFHSAPVWDKYSPILLDAMRKYYDYSPPFVGRLECRNYLASSELTF
jgi:hypothetical protein